MEAVLLSLLLLLCVLLALGDGETLDVVEADLKLSKLIAPAGLGLAVVLSLKLTLLRVVAEADARRVGEVERLGVKDIKAVIVSRALPVREALAQPVELRETEALAVSEAEVVPVAETEELCEEESEARRVRDWVLLAKEVDEEVAEAQEETLPLPHLRAAAPLLGLGLPVLLSLCEKVGDEVEVGQPEDVEDSVGEVVDVEQPVGEREREAHWLMEA